MPYGDYIGRGTDPTYLTTANEANPLIPVEISNKIIEGIAEKSAAMRLMSTMRMSRHIKTLPVLATLPTAYWVTDPNGLKQTTDMSWRNVNLVAEELAVIVVIPDVVIKDANTDVWAHIRPRVEEAFGKALDEAVLFGINKPPSWPLDIKAGAIAALNTVTVGASTIDIAQDVNNVMAAVEADGYFVSGFAMGTPLIAQFRGLRDDQNGLIFNSGQPGVTNASFANSSKASEGMLWNTRAVAVRNGSFETEKALALGVELIGGDWDQAILAVREDFNVQFSNSAVLQDGAGVITHNAWQHDLTIGRFTARFAYAVPNPVNRLQPTDGSRWPFAVLREAA